MQRLLVLLNVFFFCLCTFEFTGTRESETKRTVIRILQHHGAGPHSQQNRAQQRKQQKHREPAMVQPPNACPQCVAVVVEIRHTAIACPAAVLTWLRNAACT